MNDVFVKNALTRGEAGAKWLKQIPEIINAYSKRWNLHILTPYNLTYNYVTPALSSDGSKVVLKIGYPKDEEFQTEISALILYDGEASCKILNYDRENNVVLLEQISPGVPLSGIEDDERATSIIASVMKKIRKPLPKNHSFITIKEWANELFQYPARFKGNTNPPAPFKLINKAIDILNGLLKSSSPAILTHADLHHDNVLSSDRDGWLSIDPKGIAAEPEYETAAMIRNPYNKLKDISDQKLNDLLLNRIYILSKELKFAPGRIHMWCFVQTVLSGVWTMDSAKDVTHALKIANVLDKIAI